MKKMISILLLAVMVLSLAGCQGGVDTKQANAEVAAFFDAAIAGDYEAAKAYLHPSNADILLFSFEYYNFPKSATVTDAANFSWSWYDGSVGGSQYTRDYTLTAGDAAWAVSVQVVQNEAGYGIYSLDIQPVA